MFRGLKGKPMAMSRGVFGFLFAFLSACATAEDTNETAPQSQNSYRYINLREPIEDISVVNYSDLKLVTRSDLEIGVTIVDEPAQTAPIILVFDRPYNVAFYLPEDFGPKSEQWTYLACKYRTIGHSWGFRSPVRRDVHEYLIEQKCENDPKIVRYEYADFYGLQAFVIGAYKDTSTASDFHIEEAYSLYGAKFGFGARQ